NVVNLALIISSNGVLIQINVPMSPDNIVAMTPIPEYLFQKKVSRTATDKVEPTPAHAHPTTVNTRLEDKIAITSASKPVTTMTILETSTYFSSFKLILNLLFIKSSLIELLTFMICDVAVVIIAARIPDINIPAIQGGVKSMIIVGSTTSSSAKSLTLYIPMAVKPMKKAPKKAINVQTIPVILAVFASFLFRSEERVGKENWDE